jgi:hypothetical protein
MLFDDLEIAQIVVESNPGVVDEDIECVDVVDGLSDLRNIGHVQRQGRYALIRMLQWPASTGIHPVRPALERLIDERLTDPAVGPRDQNCLLFDVHRLLLSGLPSSAITAAGAERIRRGSRVFIVVVEVH